MKSWLKNAVFYEIYPQSFCDTNGDGIGDFEGIIQKLDYIRELGFTAIWMNPCFDSPFRDAGYDVKDFYKAAPRYGTNEDLKRLFREAHKRDMHVILDLVPGHTSVDCHWFRRSMEAKENEYSHRYVWTDNIWTDIQNVPGIVGTLRGISDRDGCCGVNFFSAQPALNYGFAQVTESWQHPVDSPAALATREEILNIIRFWLEMGADGFRVDMAGSLVKNDPGQEETIRLWQELFAVINQEFPEAAFVSEWGEPEKALRGGYDMDFLLHFGPSHYLDMYHSPKPYFCAEGCGSAKDFFAYYLDVYRKTSAQGGLICLPSGNHDMPRLSYFCDSTQMKLVYAFMMSMPGVPFVYYGDEIGMRYLPGITSVEGGYNRTGARTPMQWDDSPNCGFSTADADRLYIMLDPGADRPTAASQMADPDSILNELKRIIAVRKANPALQESAAIEVLHDGYPLVYKRSADDASVLVVINPSDRPQTFRAENCAAASVLYSFGGTAEIKQGLLTAPPCSASYLLL